MTPHDPHLTPSSTDATMLGPTSGRAADGMEMVSGANQDTVVPPPTASVTPPPVTREAATFGRYELLSELARGGMGVVYRARQQGLDRLVALKMILGVGVDADTAGRFLREAQAAAALDHPNVVPVYDSGEVGGRPYFTMALIDGPNLREYVEARGTPPMVQAAGLFAQIIAGVAHAHRHGIIHRDLKPANVLIDQDGRPRVTDFGLAKRVTTNAHLTATGQVVGTPAYMSPEQARDSKDVGPPADVYALGAILYFLLTGHPPFEGGGVTDLLIKVVTEQPTAPSVYNPGVPTAIEELCLRCLAKSPGDRPANAEALAVAFAAVAAPFLPVSSGSLPLIGGGLPGGLTPVDPSRADARTVLSAPIPFPISRPVPLSPATTPAPQPVARTPAPAPLAPSVPSTSGTTDSAEPPGRRSLTAGLLAAAVLLGGVMVYLLVRGGKPVDPGQPTPDQPPPDQAAAITPAPSLATFPPPTRADFGLRVELTAPAARKAPGAVVHLSPGAPMQIHLRADRDCRAVVWAIDPAGHATKLFPNDDDPDDRLTAGVERILPGNQGYILEATTTEGDGAERLRVVATTGEPPAYPPGAKSGRYSFYSSEQDREKLASAVRGVSIKKVSTGGEPAGAVAEAELLFRVQK